MTDFQAFTTETGGRTNVLFCKVGVSQAFDLNSNSTEHKPITEVNVIWDTGASCTIITKELATKIGLIPTGKEIISGIDHDSLENTFFVNVFLPNKVCMTDLKIVEVPSIKNADMLIGMDIIGSGDLSLYSENGKTIMSYRYPSIGGTNFVSEANTISTNRAYLQKFEQERQRRKQSNNNKKKKHKH